MHLALGNISSIISWFNSQNNPSKFLCLLIAGHLRDIEFFSDLFEQRLALDTISGPNITILLFTNDPVGIMSIAIDSGGYEIIPGQKLGDKNSRGFSYHQHISEITFHPDMREKVINASQSMAYQICKHFKLRQEDIPSILVLSKGNSEPSVIQTRGEADVQVFYEFLKDLRKIADILPNKFELYEPLKLVESLVKQGQLAEAIETHKRAEAELQAAKNTCITSLSRMLLVSPEKSQEFFKNEQSIRCAVELAYRYPLFLKESSSHLELQQACEDDVFRENYKKLGSAWGRYKKSQKVLLKRKKQADRLLKWSKDSRSIEEAIIQLCKRYENKFRLKAFLRPLKEATAKVIGGGKVIQDLISVEQTIKKLIEP